MSKVHSTITLDEELIERAKQLRLNVSGELNYLLRQRLKPVIKDLPSENLLVTCSECRQQIIEGYWCQRGEVVLCKDCQRKWDMVECVKRFGDNHLHIYWNNSKEQVFDKEKTSVDLGIKAVTK